MSEIPGEAVALVAALRDQLLAFGEECVIGPMTRERAQATADAVGEVYRQHGVPVVRSWYDESDGTIASEVILPRGFG